MINKKLKFSFLFFITLNCIAQTTPSYRITDWTNPGNTAYLRNYPRVIDVTSYGAVGNGVHIDDTAIIRVMDSLTLKGGIAYLPTGNYLIKRSIAIPKNVTLRGAGSANSILKFNLGGSGDCITATGTATGSWFNLIGSSPIGRGYIDASGHNFTAGNWIRIKQNDSTFINDSWSSGYIGQISKVDSVNGNRVYINKPIRVYLSSTLSPQCIKLTVSDSIGIEDLRITRRDATSGQTSNINFTYVANSWIYGVQSDSCNFSHITLNKCSNILVHGCYFSTAFAYGSGGQGYGITSQFGTGQCLIENNIFRRLRHSMLFQACANGNVYGFNYSLEPFQSGFFPTLSGEIVLHGNYNYMNLFEGNICTNIIIDNSHGKNGMYNTFFRNRATNASIGIYMTSTNSDSQNYVGNEVANFTLAGSGHFQHNNNKNGTYYASGTTTLNDQSYYLSATPSWWDIGGNWPSIGGSNTLNSGTNPAKNRYINNSTKTISLGYNTSLPVTWLSFDLKYINGNVKLYWKTASEVNTESFILEKSINGKDYYPIFKIKAAGNSQVVSAYSFTDFETNTTLTYYRIKQYDFDGKFSYSSIKTFILNNQNKEFIIFPNPNNGILNLNFNKNTQPVSIKIFDSFGKIIFYKHNNEIGLTNQWNIDLIPDGVYHSEIRTRSKYSFDKIIVKH